MNDHPRADAHPASPDAPAEKHTWHTPGLDEVDFIDTEAGSGSYTYADNTTYNS
jgi:hypothetical protein